MHICGHMPWKILKKLLEVCAQHVIIGYKRIKVRKKNLINFFHYILKTSRCDANQFFRLPSMFFIERQHLNVCKSKRGFGAPAVKYLA